MRLSLAIDHVIDAVHDGTAGHRPWDAYVCDGVAWLFEHHRIEQPRALVDMVGQTLGDLCSGAEPPPLDDRHRACDDLAGAVVLASL